ncbi:DNAJ domain protein, exocytosis associated Mug184 [Schizosaccharomyces pombe]|uniref:Meiotically up-regulated gene 184 protein n=1 Tax=Schizosaccharomyces pombe (strain 972 / ATCC 24843) TaxID=284812 RepID=MU184_SCHPO|nr:protein mug184 [Schizosaccharomyces pombe]O94566.2 RecName: Full=Meiotically up-regulated gene 184 protein [Schizosaccharomyces pombe 972h-]CAA21914.2 meiotically upregulated gene Mug184 [Schizosaccharomyces pombe]|eukprot:NP_595124.1 protein mug184 [Schizosaccharomyces pombe]
MLARPETDTSVDYYAILKLQKNATFQQIRKQYLFLALQYHPDRNPGDEERAVKRFQRLQLAHEVLSDATKRLIYDQLFGLSTRTRSQYKPNSTSNPSKHTSAYASYNKGKNSKWSSPFASTTKKPQESSEKYSKKSSTRKKEHFNKKPSFPRDTEYSHIYNMKYDPRSGIGIRVKRQEPESLKKENNNSDYLPKSAMKQKKGGPKDSSKHPSNDGKIPESKPSVYKSRASNLFSSNEQSIHSSFGSKFHFDKSSNPFSFEFSPSSNAAKPSNSEECNIPKFNSSFKTSNDFFTFTKTEESSPYSFSFKLEDSNTPKFKSSSKPVKSSFVFTKPEAESSNPFSFDFGSSGPKSRSDTRNNIRTPLWTSSVFEKPESDLPNKTAFGFMRSNTSTFNQKCDDFSSASFMKEKTEFEEQLQEDNDHSLGDLFSKINISTESPSVAMPSIPVIQPPSFPIFSSIDFNVRNREYWNQLMVFQKLYSKYCTESQHFINSWINIKKELHIVPVNWEIFEKVEKSWDQCEEFVAEFRQTEEKYFLFLKRLRELINKNQML